MQPCAKKALLELSYSCRLQLQHFKIKEASSVFKEIKNTLGYWAISSGDERFSKARLGETASKVQSISQTCRSLKWAGVNRNHVTSYFKNYFKVLGIPSKFTSHVKVHKQGFPHTNRHALLVNMWWAPQDALSQV